MSPEDQSRRQFLKSAGAMTGAHYLRLLAPAAAAIAQAACSARDEGQPFTVLSKDEAADFAAIAARIVPTTDTPGATEAGVIWFIDRAFSDEMQGELEFARNELAGFNARISGDDSKPVRFSDLDEAAQDAYLKTQDSSPLFNMLWEMTIFGMFAMPMYGGNRDKAGWELVGFVGDQGPWQYPFGYYDAEVQGENTSDDV